MSYDSSSIEKRWEDMWRDEAIYRFDPKSDKPVFSIDNPPRYTSGNLHLGHATGYSLIDFAARYKRMRGYNVFYPLCFDVNGTPIEVRVEKKHHITKLDLPREEYRKLCSDYANGFIAQMTKDFEMLGQSMDPSIYYQTDAPYYRQVTQRSFVQLFDRGLVYKANFPVNWCPRCMTALADAEVEYEDNVNKLNYLRFQVDGEDDSMVIATTRPELLCTCKVVAVHPDDEEKRKYVGKRLVTPIYGRKVEVIADPKVDVGYGTGNVMICTIGDKADLEWIMKYRLELEKGIDETGRMTELAGKYAGMPVKEAREAAIADLKASGVLIKQEDNPQQVSVCWRCKTPIEFLQVPQWFLKTRDFREQILKRADEIKWHPEFMKVRLQDWANSLEWDWVLSRQRIFATPIPVWECKECGRAVCATEEMCYCDPTLDRPPVDRCPGCGGELVGCTDVFDTWMDSSGSCLYNTYWGRDEELHKKMFPMSLRPQSHDIIRTWAFYSILRAQQIEDCRPWDDILIHGFIMAPDGTPMHTSVGNVIDPIPILEKYGADALRYFAANCSLGIDHAFREKDCVRGKKICIKVYNLGQFVGRYFEGMAAAPERPEGLRTADRWILGRLSRTVSEVTADMDAYSFDKAMSAVERFVWHVFADDYVEMVKGRDDDAVRYTLYRVFLDSIKLLAPFMPHITEEVYQSRFRTTDGARSVHLTSWPEPGEVDGEAVRAGDAAAEIVAAVRAWKSERKMNVGAELDAVEVIGGDVAVHRMSEEDIRQGCRARRIAVSEKADLTETVSAVKPVFGRIGPLFKGDAKLVSQAIASADPSEIAAQASAGKITVSAEGRTFELSPDLVDIKKTLSLNGREVSTVQCGDALLVIEQRPGPRPGPPGPGSDVHAELHAGMDVLPPSARRAVVRDGVGGAAVDAPEAHAAPVVLPRRDPAGHLDGARGAELGAAPASEAYAPVDREVRAQARVLVFSMGPPGREHHGAPVGEVPPGPRLYLPRDLRYPRVGLRIHMCQKLLIVDVRLGEPAVRHPHGVSGGRPEADCLQALVHELVRASRGPAVGGDDVHVRVRVGEPDLQIPEELVDDRRDPREVRGAYHAQALTWGQAEFVPSVQTASGHGDEAVPRGERYLGGHILAVARCGEE